MDQMMEHLLANKSTGVTDKPDEESRGSGISTARTESVGRKRRMKTGGEKSKEFTVEQVVEYQWPLEKSGKKLMIQEQISEYLGVKSFQRNYPYLKRRTVKAEEKMYLREKGLVTESLCNLGLTAVNSSEILDIMFCDFQEKYEEYCRFMRARKVKEIAAKQKAVLAATNDEKNKLDYRNKAIRSAAAWNSTFNRSCRDQRRCSFDLQSFTIHYPQNRFAKTLPKEHTKPGPYPLALMPGQYADFYESYTIKPNERQQPNAGSDVSRQSGVGSRSRRLAVSHRARKQRNRHR
jgi:hypothetical protein